MFLEVNQEGFKDLPASGLVLLVPSYRIFFRHLYSLSLLQCLLVRVYLRLGLGLATGCGDKEDKEDKEDKDNDVAFSDKDDKR